MGQVENFDSRLKHLLAVSGVGRGELAERLDVPVPLVNRWLNGASAPDIYQFRAIADCFGVPCGWFLDGGDGFPSAKEVAGRLGLPPETVEALRELADAGKVGVLSAVDDAVCAVIGAACAAYGGVLPLAEQFSSIAEDALALADANTGEGR